MDPDIPRIVPPFMNDKIMPNKEKERCVKCAYFTYDPWVGTSRCLACGNPHFKPTAKEGSLLQLVEDKCIFCLLPFQSHKRFQVTLRPCNHEMHERCLLDWYDYLARPSKRDDPDDALHRKRLCPICRTPIFMSENSSWVASRAEDKERSKFRAGVMAHGVDCGAANPKMSGICTACEEIIMSPYPVVEANCSCCVCGRSCWYHKDRATKGSEVRHSLHLKSVETPTVYVGVDIETMED